MIKPSDLLTTQYVIDTDICDEKNFSHPSSAHILPLKYIFLPSLERYFLVGDESLCGRRETEP